MKCAKYDINTEDGFLRALKLVEDRTVPYIIETSTLCISMLGVEILEFNLYFQV